jgi:hypothetical protein
MVELHSQRFHDINTELARVSSLCNSSSPANRKQPQPYTNQSRPGKAQHIHPDWQHPSRYNNGDPSYHPQKVKHCNNAENGAGHTQSKNLRVY